jgi:hypothetical protein
MSHQRTHLTHSSYAAAATSGSGSDSDAGSTVSGSQSRYSLRATTQRATRATENDRGANIVRTTRSFPGERRGPGTMVNTVSAGGRLTSTIAGSTSAAAGTSTASTTISVGVTEPGPALGLSPPGFGAITAGSGAGTLSAFSTGQAPIPTGQQRAPLPTQTQYEREAAQVQLLDDQAKQAAQAKRDSVLKNVGFGLGTTATTTLVIQPEPIVPNSSQREAEKKNKEADEAKGDAIDLTESSKKDKGVIILVTARILETIRRVFNAHLRRLQLRHVRE